MSAKWRKSFNPLGGLRSTYYFIFSPILILSSPFMCGLFFYCATKSERKQKSTDSTFRDSEFSGFSLVSCPSPYLQKSSDHPNSYCILPVDMANGADMARNILTNVLDPCDVIVASYPKSGTTWISEAVYLMVHNLDWNKAASGNLEERVPYMEYLWPGVHVVAKRSSPRVIKTHLPFDHLPESVQRGQAARIIYITRDPRDTVISYYHFARSFLPAGYRHKEGLDGFVNRFLDDRLPYSPWVHHVKSYMKAAAFYSTEKLNPKNSASKKFDMSPKVLIITYEMLQSDMESTLRKIEQFLQDTWSNQAGAPSRPCIITPSNMAQLCAHCSFENMSKNSTTNFTWMKNLGLWSDEYRSLFMRQGSVGNHRQWLRPEQCDQITKKALEDGLGWTLKD